MSLQAPIPFKPQRSKLPTPEEADALRKYCVQQGYFRKTPPSKEPAKRKYVRHKPYNHSLPSTPAGSNVPQSGIGEQPRL